MNKIFKNLIKSLQDIKLSESKKALVRSRIAEFISFNPIRGEAHVPRERTYISIFEVGHFAKASALVLIFAVVIGGSGVSYAASNALPGQVLYNIKVNVNEKIEGGLAFSSGTKVAVESKKVERRLEEAQALVKDNKLSTENKELLQKKIEEHIEELEEKIDDLKKDGDYALVLETTGKLAPVLEIHKDILIEKSLDESGDTEDSATLIATVEDSIQKMTAEENDILAIALDTETNTETSTPGVSLMMATDISAEEEAKQAQAKITKEAEDAIEEISDDVKEIVKDRIQAAKDKIKVLRIEQEALEKSALQAVKDIEIKTPDPIIIDETIAPAFGIEAASKVQMKEIVLPEAATTEMVVESMEIVPEPVGFDIMTKIKDAEKLIREAEDYVERGKYKEALAIAQNVNHIASEIETYKKLHELELAQADSSDLKASVIESSK